jgi:hypothetical protein
MLFCAETFRQSDICMYRANSDSANSKGVVKLRVVETRSIASTKTRNIDLSIPLSRRSVLKTRDFEWRSTCVMRYGKEIFIQP